MIEDTNNKDLLSEENILNIILWYENNFIQN